MSLVGRSDVISRTLARDRLGTPSIGLFALAHEAPLLVIGGVVTTGFAVTGLTGFGLAFPLIAVVLILWAVGYTAMGRRVANAGAFPSYAAAGLGRLVAVGALTVALVAYNALQVGLYGLLGASTAPLLDQVIGLDPAWWITAALAWVAIAFLGAARVDINKTILAGLILAELVWLAVAGTASLFNAKAGITVDTFTPGDLVGPGPGAGAAFVMVFLANVGCESPTVYSEESRNPLVTVRRAIIGSLVLVGVVYTFGVWTMTLSTGTDEIVARSQAASPDLLFQIAQANLGTGFADLGRFLILFSAFAGALAFHNTTARQLYAAGREGVLPTWLAKTSRRGAPRNGSLLQTVIGLAAIVAAGVLDLKPIEHLFFWAGTGGGYGILLLVTLTGLAVLVYFARHPGMESAWTRWIAPSIALLGLLAITYAATTDMHTLLALPGGTLTRWAIPGLYLVLAAVGIGYGLYLRARRQQVYARIGMGAKAAAPTMIASPVRVGGVR